MKLKLIGAERYVGPGTENEVAEKGAVITMTDKQAADALNLSYMDASNNVHPLFVVYDDKEEVAEEDVEQEEDSDSPKKPPRALRKLAK